jgi:4-amino-4-deoxy-L-arabinose transferase-like glycosyltransferase
MIHGRISKPEGLGRTEQVKLDSAAAHLLEECRMVLPGIQALFGFQLIAIFNQGFDEKLSAGEQQLHFIALFLVAVAAGLVMAPAAIHRQTQQREVSERFIWLSSMLVLFSMLPLALGLSLDVYLIARVVFESARVATAFAAALFLILMALWFALPRREGNKGA